MSKGQGSHQKNFFSGNRNELPEKIAKAAAVMIAGAILLPFVALAVAGMGMSFPPITLNKMLHGGNKASPDKA